MSYELACEQLYQDRLEKQQRLQAARDKFRQTILNRQNNTSHNVSYRNEGSSGVVDGADFIMPVNLPTDEARLKKLIVANFQLKMDHPDRVKEANENIKRIKDFVNEQKARQKLPA